jgi:hypothetical protein
MNEAIMKKTIVLISLFILMATVAFAQVEPNIIQLGNFSDVNEVGEPDCVYGGNGFVYCAYMSSNYNKLYSYELATDAWTEEATLPDTGGGYAGELAAGVLYNSKIYMFKYNWTSTSTSVIEYDVNSNIFTTVADLPEGQQELYECDLRPSTDEIWCLGLTADYPTTLRKYDISTQTFTDIATISYQEMGGGIPPRATCIFRNSDEFWCTGGRDDSFAMIDKHLVYSINQNTTTEYQAAIGLWEIFCRWHGDILYCYGGDDSNEMFPTMFYYNPTGNIYGNLTTEWTGPEPNQHTAYSGGCTEINSTTDFCKPPYFNNNWDSDVTTWLIDWGPVPEVIEEPEPEAQPTTGGDNNAFFVNQNLAKQAQVVNPIEQFILNLRAFLLGLLGMNS